jgi:hypothetical protein
LNLRRFGFTDDDNIALAYQATSHIQPGEHSRKRPSSLYNWDLRCREALWDLSKDGIYPAVLRVFHKQPAHITDSVHRPGRLGCATFLVVIMLVLVGVAPPS